VKRNEYDCAEVIEIGTASDAILGWKDAPDLDSTGCEPFDRLYQEMAHFSE
jgi:hypothetical protein